MATAVHVSNSCYQCEYCNSRATYLVYDCNNNITGRFCRIHMHTRLSAQNILENKLKRNFKITKRN